MKLSQDVIDLNPGLEPKTLRVQGETGEKFGNRRTVVDGIMFQSGKEAKRYRELKQNQAAGAISNLRWQVNYSLDVNRRRITTYRADFVYTENGREVVEDVKGMRSGVAYDLFSIKKRLMRAIYGIEVVEI